MKERIEDQAECRYASKRQHRRALCRVTQQQYIVNDAPCANASPSRLKSQWHGEALVQGVLLSRLWGRLPNRPVRRGQHSSRAVTRFVQGGAVR
jgi:hypothetical protein